MMMDGTSLNVKKWNIIYPVYINSKKTVAEGRRIGVEKACENPACIEINNCCNYLKFPCAIEVYPRDFMQRWRVRVLLKRKDVSPYNPVIALIQEAASGNIFVQMPDVWVNLAHVYFAQGHFALAVKMDQNCWRKFYYNTDTQVLYLARTHYEAEHWQEWVALQKFSALTLQKTKRTADEILYRYTCIQKLSSWTQQIRHSNCK